MSAGWPTIRPVGMRWLGVLVVLLGSALWPVTSLTAPAQADDHVPRPVLNVDFPDPAVVAAPRGLVAYSTGDRVPHARSLTARGRWRAGGAVLHHRPRWAVEGGIWAVDVARIRGVWLLYYAVPVAGIVEHGRCIGVAKARTPRGPFMPVRDRPLVCPSYADTPLADDALEPRDPTLPRAGVIDPSVHTDAAGRHWLLYKTDRVPSSIRLLPLSQDGRRVRDGAVSQEILRHDGVIENPVLVTRPEGHVLLASEGDWTRCGYRTLWFRTADLLDWSAAESGVLLDQDSTGLCGPGGADVAGTTRLFLHGWTCHRSDLPCRGGAKWDHRRRARGVRAMYAATLRWPGGVPQVTAWLGPR